MRVRVCEWGREVRDTRNTRRERECEGYKDNARADGARGASGNGGISKH